MRRGPAPVIWKETALPIAQNRGQVMIFTHSVHNLADFVIVGNGTLAFVRMRKVQRLHCPPEKIEADLQDEVDMLRRIPGGSVSRELWPYSRYGVLRFFRVGETGLAELRSDGQLLSVSPKKPSSAGAPEDKVALGASGTPAPTVSGVAE
jgi:hypothetical protein